MFTNDLQASGTVVKQGFEFNNKGDFEINAASEILKIL